MMTMRFRIPWLAASAVTLLAVLHAESALAQGPSVDTLFQEAREAFNAGDYATACPKFEEVVRIKPGLGARIALGHCYRERGELVRALEVYEGVIADAPALEVNAATQKDKDTVKERAKAAVDGISALAPRVGRFTIAIPAAQLKLPGFSLRIDGSPVPPEKIGKATWSLPGKYQIEASATGFVTDVRSFEVVANGTQTIEVKLVPEKPAVKPKNKKPLPVTEQKTDPSRTPIWAWVAGGVGVSALAVGTVFVIPYMNARDAIASDCPDGTCSLPGVASRYQTQWNNSVAMMAGFWSAGAVGVGVCLAGVLASRRTAPRDANTIGFAPWVNARDGGLLIHGSF